MTNRIQSLLGVEYPVIQAPMTYIARAELAAAVSEGGGLGMIETLTPEGRADLRRVRDLTDRPVAANLMIQGWKNLLLENAEELFLGGARPSGAEQQALPAQLDDQIGWRSSSVEEKRRWVDAAAPVTRRPRTAGWSRAPGRRIPS